MTSLLHHRLVHSLRRATCTPPHWRAYSSLKDGGAQTAIYTSASHNPYFNLAFEDWLFRTSPVDSTVLLFYRNDPCIIIGRNQNPWKEINFRSLRASSIPFVRRRSGGGTVYHDLGNTNYSIAMPRQNFDRTSNAELVARALVNSLDIPASVNERNDIVVDGSKISSAYKIVSKRAYHHGTMLIDARLKDLGTLLHNTKSGIVTKGVDSVRSPVTNLKQFHKGINHDAFVEAVSQSFRKTYGGDPQIQHVREVDYTSNESVMKGMDELQSWEWAHGQTPEFTHDMRKTFSWGKVTANIHSKKGIILDSTIKYKLNDPTNLMHDTVTFSELHGLQNELPGLAYGFTKEKEFTALRECCGWRGLEVLGWLKEEM